MVQPDAERGKAAARYQLELRQGPVMDANGMPTAAALAVGVAAGAAWACAAGVEGARHLDAQLHVGREGRGDGTGQRRGAHHVIPYVAGHRVELATGMAQEPVDATGEHDGACAGHPDALERLRLAHSGLAVQLDWGQKLTATSCVDVPCKASAWRDSLLADWQTQLSREAPQVQTWLAPWADDPRLQVVGLRWPEPGAPAQVLPLNQLQCPADWRCVAMLGWR